MSGCVDVNLASTFADGNDAVGRRSSGCGDENQAERQALTHRCDQAIRMRTLAPLGRAQQSGHPCLPKPDGDSLECLDYMSAGERVTTHEQAGTVGVNRRAECVEPGKSM